MENEESFDSELFIEEIRQFPCIWDYSSTSYCNRTDKAKAWDLICSKFYVDFLEKEKQGKNKIAAALQRKWKSLRDSYNRELRKNTTMKSGSGASKHRQYLYFHNLTFLQNLDEKRVTESSLADSQSNEDSQQKEHDAENDGQCPTSEKHVKRKKLKTKDQEDQLIKQLSSSLSDRLKAQHVSPANNSTDGDLHFLLSLYDNFKMIDNNMKLQAQIEVLNVIQKYRRPPPPPTWNYDQSRYYGEQYRQDYNTAVSQSLQQTMSSYQQQYSKPSTSHFVEVQQQGRSFNIISPIPAQTFISAETPQVTSPLSESIQEDESILSNIYD